MSRDPAASRQVGQLPTNGIIVNWKSAEKPVDENKTSRDLAAV
jgi:hypothetical protein